MKIKLEDTWYLVTDERQAIISEERERQIANKENGKITTEKYMNHKTYHPTIKSALKEFLQRKLYKSSVTTFEGMIKKLEENEKLLDKWSKLAGLEDWR